MEIVQHVREALERRFPGAFVEVGLYNGAERVNGQIIWDGFEDQDQIDRQTLLRNVLREELGEDVKQVSIILTYTPYENNLMAAS